MENKIFLKFQENLKKNESNDYILIEKNVTIYLPSLDIGLYSFQLNPKSTFSDFVDEIKENCKGKVDNLSFIIDRELSFLILPKLNIEKTDYPEYLKTEFLKFEHFDTFKSEVLDKLIAYDKNFRFFSYENNENTLLVNLNVSSDSIIFVFGNIENLECVRLSKKSKATDFFNCHSCKISGNII